jgi:STE24 endopeptidase
MSNILIIIYLVLVFDFVFERILSIINSERFKRPLPVELEDAYDEETYLKSRNYKREYELFSLITASFSFILIIFMFYFKGFAFVDAISRSITVQPILQTLLFFGILFLASDLIGIPFDSYSTFIIEDKYGFNKTTPFMYVTDKLKGYIISGILGGSLLAIFVWFFYHIGHLFWIYIWLIFTIFSIFISMFYSNIIVPLFNKQTPLEDGELRKAISDFVMKVGFRIKNIYVIDGSKRSTKANAYFTGLGPKKRIILYDTLINQLSVKEIIAVLAHEIGHNKKKHTLTILLASIIQTGITLFILSLFIDNPAFSEALSINYTNIHSGMLVFGIIYSPISTITGLGMNLLSRKNEYEADRFVTGWGLGGTLINALKILSKNNLSNLNPHPFYVFFHYSHPTLVQRIKSIKKNSDMEKSIYIHFD